MSTLQSLADAPGTQREYETIYILSPDTPNEGVAKLNDRVKGVIETKGGRVLHVDNWGKRKLAYEVKKQLRGIYLYWQYLGTTGLVDELERNLRMVDTVIRFLTVRVDSNVDPTARPTEMDDEAFARAAETAADEEDLVMAGSGSLESSYGDDDYYGDDNDDDREDDGDVAGGDDRDAKDDNRDEDME